MELEPRIPFTPAPAPPPRASRVERQADRPNGMSPAEASMRAANAAAVAPSASGNGRASAAASPARGSASASPARPSVSRPGASSVRPTVSPSASASRGRVSASAKQSQSESESESVSETTTESSTTSWTYEAWSTTYTNTYSACTAWNSTTICERIKPTANAPIKISQQAAIGMGAGIGGGVLLLILIGLFVRFKKPFRDSRTGGASRKYVANRSSMDGMPLMAGAAGAGVASVPRRGESYHEASGSDMHHSTLSNADGLPARAPAYGTPYDAEQGFTYGPAR